MKLMLVGGWLLVAFPGEEIFDRHSCSCDMSSVRFLLTKTSPEYDGALCLLRSSVLPSHLLLWFAKLLGNGVSFCSRKGLVKLLKVAERSARQ